MLGITKRKNNGMEKAEELPGALPAVDVYENPREFLLVADLPGVPQGAATVTLEHERLVLQGTGALRKFRREMVVPPSIDSEQVTASMKAGVLTVHLPKRAPYQPRQIQVRGV